MTPTIHDVPSGAIRSSRSPMGTIDRILVNEDGLHLIEVARAAVLAHAAQDLLDALTATTDPPAGAAITQRRTEIIILSTLWDPNNGALRRAAPMARRGGTVSLAPSVALPILHRGRAIPELADIIAAIEADDEDDAALVAA